MRRNIRHLPIIIQKKYKFNKNRKNASVQKVPFQNNNNNNNSFKNYNEKSGY